ncbi:MAG TPA: response regulator [Micropepsaceae bacterium]|nr:response regulator [Micropepsaceae bacterium]
MSGSKLILTVDDSATIRELLLSELAGLGHRVTQAEDGINGLEKLALEPHDLIITDITMPRMDGIGFIQNVRRDERYKSIPILVLTTESDPTVKDRAKQAGATGWIVKPFDPRKLAEAIRKVTA